MTINYIEIQTMFTSWVLDFLHSDLRIWRSVFIWMLRFGGVLVAWLWLITFFAVWPGRVSYDELGPVWFTFGGVAFHAPWAALVWTWEAEGLSTVSAWLLRLCGVITAWPGYWLAKALAGKCPRLPRKHDHFAYGGHFLKDADYRATLDHAGTSGVIVGRNKALPWQKSPQLVRAGVSANCLILGDGPTATGVFKAAVKSFDSAIIRIGPDRLQSGLVADSDILCIAPSLAASCPLDPLRDRKSTRLNSSHPSISRMPSSA